MNLIWIEHLQLFLGDRALFKDVNAIINPGDRIGLVGPNGAGKSTLLKVLCNIRESDGGVINKKNGVTIGYLPQDGVEANPDFTVFEEVQSACTDMLRKADRLNEIHDQLEKVDHSSEAYTKLLDEYGHLQTQLELLGFYTLDADIKRTLSGLGFESTDFNRPTTEFSGGWLMRIALAKLLLQKPDVLLLDEPTNHLDIDSVQWIEQFLRDYSGAILIVSHDRTFLDQLCNRTLVLQQGIMRSYEGNYSFYEKEFEREKELLQNAYENQQQQIKQTEQFISRFRAKATKAKQVQSRVKQLEKIDRIELEEDLSGISFDFPPAERPGQVVMELKGLDKAYDDHIIFKNLDLEISRGDRIAVVGPNGAGKSTLIRILAGIEAYQGGECISGHKVTSTYYAQHQAEDLPLDSDPLSVMQSVPGNFQESYLRSILGCFLFRGDDVFKPVNVLSGGEKSRLALAKMLLNPANFIILDEPTNHLDMTSKEILQKALLRYEGTYAIVSHDRYFLDPIVNKVIEVRPGSKVKTYLGNLSYYLEKKAEEEQTAPSSNNASNGSQSKSDSSKLSRKEQKRIEAERRQRLGKVLRPLKKELNDIEEKIAQLEERQQEIETAMAQPDFYNDEAQVKEVSLEYEKLKAEIVVVMSRWEELTIEIEEVESSDE